jgi:putative ABC transport system permease protein
VYNAEVEGADGVLDVPTYIVDYDYVPMMGVEVVAGRPFSEQFPTDGANAFMVNEAAVRRFGWDEPVGKSVVWDDTKRGTVIGVVKDFHYRSLKEAVEPLVMHVDPDYMSRLSVRVRSTDFQATLEFLDTTYRQFDANHPFAYSLLDEDFARYYVASGRSGRLVRYASVLAVLIACLGLLGLASSTAQRRMKEIGVRKVLGASAAGITFLLSRDLAKLVLVGIVVACPVAYWFVSRWLADFAYRIEITWPVFAEAGLLGLLVALFTVGGHAMKAALTDPVKVLRYE